MAKKEVEEAKVQAQEAEVSEGTQEGTQQPANGDEEAPDEQQTKPNKQTKKVEVADGVKKVKIHTTESVDAIIAGIPYVIAEHKDAQVPADVAAILVNAHKAYRM